jgi:hypothetical protein
MACAIHGQRRDLLAATGEPYVMCAGTFPCCGFDKPCPECCLWTEACCCAGNAMAGNRFMTQTRFNLKNSGCDSCLRVCHICTSIECCVARICCDCSKETENLCKAGSCVCPCTHCQNAVEINQRRKKGQYKGPPAAMVDALPEHFDIRGISHVSAPVQMQPL